MNTEDIIFELEIRLQQPEVRKSVEQLNELISEDLVEFGSSGLAYTKQDVLQNLPDSPEIKFVMTDFKVNELSNDVVQSTFKTEKTDLQTGKVSRSLRSSLWRREGNTWKMIFHQGTPFA